MPRMKKQSLETIKKLKKGKVEASSNKNITPVMPKQPIQLKKDANKNKKVEKRKDTEFLAEEMRLKRIKRDDDSYKSLERIRDRKRKASLRGDENFRSQEKEYDKRRKTISRQDENYRTRERIVDKQVKVVLRRDDIYRLCEQQKDRERKNVLRTDETYRSLERNIDRERKNDLRTDETYRSLERNIDRERKNELRTDETYRSLERNIDRERKNDLRTDETYRSLERNIDRERKNVLRTDEVYRSLEREIDREWKIDMRQDEAFRSQEKYSQRLYKSQARENEETLMKERVAKRIKRQDESYRTEERERDRVNKQLTKTIENIQHQIDSDLTSVAISLTEFEKIIKDRPTESCKQLTKTIENIQHQIDSDQSSVAIPLTEFDKVIKDRPTESCKQLTKTNIQHHIDSDQTSVAMPLTDFELLIKEGPTESCNCCLRLIFPRLACTVPKDPIIEKFGLTFVEQVFYEQHRETFCGTCAAGIKRGDTPTLCHQNYKIIFDIPSQLKGLTILEERLVSPRIPFMQIRSLGYGRQCSIRGQVVNVPMEINTTVRELPRNVDDTHTIQLKLMRKMSYKYAYITETIRPKKVFDALKYLVEQPLYRSEKIVISQQFLNSQIQKLSANNPDDLKDDRCGDSSKSEVEGSPFRLPDIGFDSDDELEEEIVKFIENNPMNVNDDDLDEFEREDKFAYLNPAGEETLLDNTKIENIAFAPGEGQLPIHMLFDENAEELSFPTIFCGNSKEFKKKMSYAQIAKLQASHRDRRFARTDFVLYMFKKSQMIAVIDRVSMAIRKKIAGNDTYTAGQIRNKDFIAKLIQADEGYRFLKDIRTSPAHWELEKRKLVAMIRQFDIPTFFITISAAETMWPELLVILSKVVDDKIISETEASRLEYNEKTRLIRSDPIVCARYFDNRYHLLLKHMKSKDGPFKDNPIKHYYYRVEFQHRGSPHVHGLFWLENAPVYNPESIDSKLEVAAFVNKYISCNADNILVQDVIKYQIHHHSKTCSKLLADKKVCRFNVPFWPSDITMVLEPNKLKLSKEKQIRFKELLGNITIFLNSNKEDITFSDFLLIFNTNIGEYRELLKNVIKKPTIVLKRKVKDCCVNPFNTEIFRLQKSNMDIQFVLDPFACMAYIVNYINKPERGVSKLMRDAMADIKMGNLTIKEQLKKLGHIFLNASEVSAQEAAYNILQMHLSEASDSYVNINTRPYYERVKMLKKPKDLGVMAADDTEIYESGLIEHYIQRPESLDNTCLAEFAAYYTFTKSKRVKTHLNLKDGSGALSKKQNPKIISFVRYGFLQDPVNFYREQLMLYHPWRDEVKDIENADQVQIYQAEFKTISENRMKFDKINEEILDAALKAAEHQNDDLFQHSVDGDIDDEFIPYAVKDPKFDPMQCLDHTTIKPQKKDTKQSTFQTPFQIDDKSYLEMIASLNAKQYEFLNHVLNNVFNDKVIYNTVSGQAGVGKSLLISAIHQSILRHYNSLPGNDPNLIKVLLCAPTGKAAYNIKGLTLHGAFGLPVNSYSSVLAPLNQDTINTMHTNLIDLKLIIIDEFSMVGSKMFHNIDERLKQLFKNKTIFGGISVILFGDIRQLPPVGDRWIFSPHKGNAYNIICGSYLWEQFKYFELTEIMRQKDDKLFAIALNNMAKGEMTPDDIQLMKSREVIDDSITVPSNAIHLFKSNKLVDSFNEKRLSEYDTETSYSIAQDIVKGSCAEKTKQLMLQQAKKLSKSDSFGLIMKLQLQIDAKYMVSVNMDTQDGIVNGASCVLRYVQKDESGNPTRIWVEFDDKDSGKKTREKYSDTIRALKFSSNWTPLELTAKAIKIRREGNLFVERKQFAILPAEAITIHKSQGATYTQVAIHIEPNIARNFLYVACSRVTSLKGLYIYGKFVPPKKPDFRDLANIELKKLRETKCLKSKYSEQFREGKSEFVITYQNIEGFNAHKSLITNNPIFVNSDIILFVETWNRDNNDISMDGFTNFANISRCAKDKMSIKGYGISCYCKNAISKYITLKSKFEENKKYSIQSISFTFKDTLIGVFYFPPNYPQKVTSTNRYIHKFIEENDNVDTLMIGDFNQDLKVDKRNSTVSILESMNFSSELKFDTSTTKLNTHIDWCFSNCERCTANTYETVFSHHKAIAVSLHEHKVDKKPLTQSFSVNGDQDCVADITPKVTKHSVLNYPKPINPTNTNIRQIESTFSSDISNENMKFKLDGQDKDEIKTCDAYLGDQVINRFHEVLSNFSRQEHTINEHEFYPQDVLYWQSLDLLNSRVHEILSGTHNIQILFGGQVGSVGHWICTYYDGNVVHIYDSLNYGRITDDSIQRYLNRLYPFKPKYLFPKVQQQSNNTDCGLHAIANAVSIYFKMDPKVIRYRTTAMRSHLWKIFTTNVLELFPTIDSIRIDRPVHHNSLSPIELDDKDNVPELYPRIDSIRIDRPIDHNLLTPIEVDDNEIVNEFSYDISDSNTNFVLGNFNKNAIRSSTGFLSAQVINRFHETLSNFSKNDQEINEREYYPQNVTFCQSSHSLDNYVKPIEKGSPHIQILNGDDDLGHWICTHYDGTFVNIYDSLNSGIIEKDSSYQKYLDKLYPFQPEYRLHEVQRQSNTYECGLFAIANAVSIYFNIELREKVKFVTYKMRSHLWKILRTNILEPFPENLW